MGRLTSLGSTPRIGLIKFLGSNCDQDCLDAFATHFELELKPVWYQQTSLPALDGLILPGGFSYGDFLRGGALAARTPILEAVAQFVKKGGALLGICNGFQILTEAQLLPGVLVRNASDEFVCCVSDLDVSSEGNSGYHKALSGVLQIRLPIAHGEGRYFIDERGLAELSDHGQILLRYQDNPNGSCDRIAGIVSRNGRVMGMMPHPERATDELLGGSVDGLKIMQAFIEACL